MMTYDHLDDTTRSSHDKHPMWPKVSFFFRFLSTLIRPFRARGVLVLLLSFVRNGTYHCQYLPLLKLVF